LRAASVRFREALAGALDNLAARTEGRPEKFHPDLRRALAEIERDIEIQIHILTDAEVRAQICARLTLYQQTVSVMAELAILSPVIAAGGLRSDKEELSWSRQTAS
jgi:hypothetical protein